MGIASRLKNRALGLSQKAMERLFADEKRATQIAGAIGAMQRGKQRFDKGQRAVMHQLNFAAKSDFKDLGKSLGSLRRRVQSLSEKLSGL